MKKTPVPIAEISSISLSPKRDTVLIVHFKQGGAMILDVGVDDHNRVSELTVDILQATKKLGSNVAVNFSETIAFQVFFFKKKNKKHFFLLITKYLDGRR